MPETESKNSRPVVFSFDCNTEFHFIEQKKQQFLYFAGVIATIIFLVFKVEINFSLHQKKNAEKSRKKSLFSLIQHIVTNFSFLLQHLGCPKSSTF